ncbi:MAG: hypothetical protein M3290_12750 [Actinomycetota bacterium]|nr:hypothetical protein [Actinomycetota bacterium]
MTGLLTAIGAVFLAGGAILAIATTTSNRLRWAVIAPLAFGTGTLILALAYGDWGPIPVTVGAYFYAAINYRNIRRARL